MADQDKRAGRGGYAAAALLWGAGLLVFCLAVVPAARQVAAAVETLDRHVVEDVGPVGVIEMSGPQRLRIHYEPITRVEGRAFYTEVTWEPLLELHGPDGARVELQQPNGNPDDPDNSTVVYRRGGRAGHTLAVADVPAAGRYELRVTHLGLAGDVYAGSIAPAEPRPRVLAVGEVPARLLKDGLVGVYGAAVVCGLLGCIGLLVGLITWARRHGSKTSRMDGRPTAWS